MALGSGLIELSQLIEIIYHRPLAILDKCKGYRYTLSDLCYSNWSYRYRFQYAYST